MLPLDEENAEAYHTLEALQRGVGEHIRRELDLFENEYGEYFNLAEYPEPDSQLSDEELSLARIECQEKRDTNT